MSGPGYGVGKRAEFLPELKALMEAKPGDL
jgi:hypothetical protein